MQAAASVPAELRPPVDAAVRWINQEQGQNFALTGLVDYEQALQAQADEPYEMGLVLCDGEICCREQVRVEQVGEDYRFSFAEAAAADIPPLLDPPAGLRSSWLADALNKYNFVLLLFYRGLW